MKNCASCQFSPANNPEYRNKPYRETPCASCENARGADRHVVNDPCGDFQLRGDERNAIRPAVTNPGPSARWCRAHIRKLRRAGMLDALDLKIIHLRQAVPMPSGRTLASKVGLSEHAVRYRLKKISGMF